MLRWCLILPVMFFVGGHDGLKLGSPLHYWQSGSFPSFGALVVVLVLLLWRLSLIVGLRRVPRELVAGAISLAILAFVILQYLPEPETGIRLLPLFPWSYSGILASILAVMVWLMIFIGIGFTYDAEGDGPVPGLFCAFMFFAFTLNAAISTSETATSETQSESTAPTKQVDFADYREAINNWRSQAMLLRQKSAQLTQDRRAIIEIMSESDSTPPLELTLEREELNQKIGRIQFEIASIENAILKSESNLRRIERNNATERTLAQADLDFEAVAMIRRELQDLAESRE